MMRHKMFSATLDERQCESASQILSSLDISRKDAPQEIFVMSGEMELLRGRLEDNIEFEPVVQD